ncbi:ATP-binding protein [Facklamia sp. P13069]|uniref:ATP-binding protein n=1 Tax=Facklamia sp. P13069 TaxID=3421954 RepID=UPI003D17A02D
MKFLWQQIIVFLIVLLTALTVSAYRISDYMEKKIYEDRELQLLRYGENIVDNYFSREDLVRASQLLSSEKIIIQVNLSDGRIIYPTYDQRFGSKLSKEDLEQIAKGGNVGLRYSQRYVDPDTQLQMATVYIPLKENQVAGFPPGFISLGAPLEDLEEKVTAMQEKVLFAYLLAGIGGLGMSVLFSIYQTNKLKQLRKASQEIASGNYEIKVNTKGQDEFADLSKDFQKMADSLVQYESEVERQETLRKQFMMDVAHEMRTPLTTMSGLLEGLRYDMIPENQVDRSLELIHSETQRLTRLVNENLDYERIRNKQISLNKVSINTEVLFENIKTQLQVKAKEKNDQLVSQIAPDFTLWADYDRITQVLINLVTNAIQFSQDSEIVLEAKMVDAGSQIKVIDHGIGIDTDQIRSIWERFYKVDVSRKNTKFGESGIGLAVVKSLVEAHNGKIEVESELNKGSVFIITLPHQNK